MARQGKQYNPLLKSYPDSVKVNRVSIGAETLYTRLIAQSDDRGCYWGSPFMVMSKLYAHRAEKCEVTVKDIAGWLEELSSKDVELVRFYEVAEKRYVQLVDCYKSLRSDVKPVFSFPEPTESNALKSAARMRDECGPPLHSTPLHSKPHPNVPKAVELPPGFQRWWEAWPKHHRKRGRADCLRVWKRMKLEDRAADVMKSLDRDKRSASWREKQGQFIPMPKTWLSQTPWEEIDEHKDRREAEARQASERAKQDAALSHEREMYDRFKDRIEAWFAVMDDELIEQTIHRTKMGGVSVEMVKRDDGWPIRLAMWKLRPEAAA